MIEEIIMGARDDADAGTFDKTVLDNKVEVGLDFALDVGNIPEFEFDAAAKAAAIAAVNGVTSDEATVEAAKAATDAFVAEGTAGETFTLTTDTNAGLDFTGNDEDNTFNAALAPAIDGLVGAQTLQGSDVLDGGAGVDTLNAELNGTGATQNPTISNVEVYNLTSFSGPLGLGGGMLDLDRATGYQQIWNRNSRQDLTLENVGEATTLGLDNVRDGSEYEVNYDNIAVAEQTVVSMTSGRPDDAVTLDIDGVAGAIETMNLMVSEDNYLVLENDADGILNLNISGDGVLALEGGNNFANLQTLDTLDYEGNVTLDVSGSGDLTSVETAGGDDTVVVSEAAVNGGLSVDMGEGADILNINDVSDDADLNAIDFTGGVTGVENVAFDDAIELGADATLNLDGVSEDLEAVWFFDGFDADGNGLTVANTPVSDLTIKAISGTADDADFDMDGGLLTVDGVANLTIDAADDADVDGGLNGDVLETLVVNAGDDLDLDLSGGLDALVSIEANATNTSTSTGGDSDANVNLDASAGALGDATEFDALKNVNVNAASSATLSMTGRAGIAAVAGIQATQSFEIDVTGTSVGYPNTQSAGDVAFNSSGIPGGVIVTDYSTTVPFLGANSGFHDSGAASDIADDLDALAELEASNSSNVVNVTWANAGVVDPLAYFGTASSASTGTLDGVTPGTFTQGADAIAQVDGEGFEAVETVSVNAEDGDADVDLTDVYGAFTLDVTATDNADVDLLNTNVTSAVVAAGTDAGDTATITLGGDTVGNAQLVDLIVSGDEADVTLAGNLDSFTTLNVAEVASDVVVDASGAIFDLAAGEFVEYQIGATTDEDDTTVDVDFTGNADAREVYNFVGDEIAEVEINNFDVSADITDPGDRLDLTGFAGSAGELVFSINADDDIVVEDLAGGLGDFGGSITIVGTYDATDAANFASFNVIYG